MVDEVVDENSFENGGQEMVPRNFYCQSYSSVYWQEGTIMDS